jgi:hypothetical protein
MFNHISNRSTGQKAGRHRHPRSLTWLMPGGASAVVAASAATALVLATGGAPQATTQARADMAPRPAVVQLTAHQIRELQHLSPAQAQKINSEIGQTFARIGMQAGIGPRPARGTYLTAQTWSGGVHWNEAWLTASYADMHSAMNRFHSQADLLAFVAGVASVLTGGLAAAICGTLALGIVLLDQKAGNVAPVTNHGVWFAAYWVPWWHTTGGYW